MNSVIEKLDSYKNFKNKTAELKNLGTNEKDIAKELGMSVYEYRTFCAKTNKVLKDDKMTKVNQLKQAGYSDEETASVLDCSLSFVKNALNN